MLKKYTVKWELRDRENQVEDQHDDERWRLGGVHILALSTRPSNILCDPLAAAMISFVLVSIKSHFQMKA